VIELAAIHTCGYLVGVKELLADMCHTANMHDSPTIAFWAASFFGRKRMDYLFAFKIRRK